VNRFLSYHGLFGKNSFALANTFSREGNIFTPLDLPCQPNDTVSTNLEFLLDSTNSWKNIPGEKLIAVAHSLGVPRLFQVINDLGKNPFSALILICPVPPGDIGINPFNWREVKARVMALGAYWPIIRQCGIFSSGWDRMVGRDYETFCRYLLPPGMREEKKREAFRTQGEEPGQVVRTAIFKRPTINWKKIDCPVIIFLGSEDRILSPDLGIGKKMATALKNSHSGISSDCFVYQTIQGMGHYLRPTDAEKIAESTFSYFKLLNQK
jgi:pimeloyl-ACP methyl ester carboxylesterase